MEQGRFIAVVGPSGVGKDSVMSGLVETTPNIAMLRRVITRAPEAGGEDYEPVDENEFIKRRDAGAFALHWQAHGLYYGVPASVDAQLQAGGDLLVNLSRGVLLDAQTRFDAFLCLSLTAPKEVLALRLAGRGRESAKEVERRLSRSTFSIPQGVPMIEIDNSGALEDTIAAIQTALYPVKE